MDDNNTNDNNGSQWNYQKQGIDQRAAEQASKGINKPGLEVLKESWENLKDAFSGSARANTQRVNKRRNDGGYPGR